jgi:hypothetical protein
MHGILILDVDFFDLSVRAQLLLAIEIDNQESKISSCRAGGAKARRTLGAYASQVPSQSAKGREIPGMTAADRRS